MKKVLALLLIATSLHATNGYLQIGYGVKSKGMGGVGVALPQDSFAAAMNPAGLALISSRFDVGIHWLQLHGSFADGTSGTSTDDLLKIRSTTNMYWPEAGVNWKFCRNMAIGISTYAVGGFQTQYEHHPETFEKLKSDYQVYFITPAWAWKINECHSIGLAFNIAYALWELRNFDGPSVAPSYLHDRANSYEQGLGFRLGWIGHLTSCFDVGVTYQTKTWMNHFMRYRGFFADSGNFDIPAQWGFAFAWKPRCFVLSLEAIRVCWTDVKMFKHDDFREGDFGSVDGRGFGWTDEWIVKLGAAVTICGQLTLRAGWNYGDQVFGGPENTLNRLTLADVEHHWTVGGTWTWSCSEFSINYVFGHNHTQEYVDVLRNRRTFTKAHQHSLGISYGRRF